MKQFIVDTKDYLLDDFKYFLKSSPPVVLCDQTRERVEQSRCVLDNIIAGEHGPIYGINTGFGKLGSVRVSDSEHETLQLYLIRSHTAGVGPPLDPASALETSWKTQQIIKKERN